jgi:stage II sporulation protein AA (anti-sigma F factor antagonist)
MPVSAHIQMSVSRMSMIQGDELIIILDGQVCYEAAEPLRDFILEQAREHVPGSLLLDCRNLFFMDSQGLAMVLHVHNHCQAANIALKLRNPSANLRNLFRLTHLDRMIDMV